MNNTTVATNNQNAELSNNNVFTVPFKTKDGIKEEVLVHAGSLMMGLYNVHMGMQKSYSEMCGFVAQLNACKAWENYYDCKNINQLVLAILHCSDGTASDLIKVAKTFYNSNGTIASSCERYNFSMLRQLCRLSDDERVTALALLDKVDDKTFTREHVKQLVDYIKSGKDASKLTVVDGRFTLPDNSTDENKSTESTDSTDGNKSTESTDSTDGNKSTESADSTDEKTASADVHTESSPLTKQSVEVIMNKLIKVRVDVDKLSKSDIKKQLSEIIEELGVISK